MDNTDKKEVVEFKSFFKTVGGNEGNKCHYPTRLDTYGKGCQHDCSYCLSPDTEILMFNGTIKLLKDIEIGDELYGIVEGDTYKKFTKSVVTNTMNVVKDTYKITLSNGNTLICSADHQWLSNRGWKYTIGEKQRPYLTDKNTLMGFNTLYNIPIYTETDDYKKGYLRGIILGDANLQEYHYDNRGYRNKDDQYHFRLVLKNSNITVRTFEYLEYFNVNTHWFDFPMVDRKTKEHYVVNGIRTNKKEDFDNIKKLIKVRKTKEFMRGFLAGFYDAEGTNDILIRRVFNTNDTLINEFTNALSIFKFTYTFDKEKKTPNGICKTVRLLGGVSENIRFNNITNCIICNNDGELSNLSLKTFNSKDLKIVSIEKYKAQQPLIDITTTTRNFVANGVISHNCYAKSLLDFRKLWDFQNPAVANIEKIRKKIATLPDDMPAIRLGGMTDCFQPLELEHRVTYETIKALNEKKQPYLIVTKSDIVAYDEYIDIMDKDLAHIQITITCFNDDLYHKLNYEKACPPSARIKAVEKLQANGFDVQVRLSPFIPEFVDFDVLNNIKCDKILVEFLRVNSWIQKWFDIDYSPYTVKQSNYMHLPLEKKKELISKIKNFKEMTVCEDESYAYNYWQENFNHNPNDCCNLRNSTATKCTQVKTSGALLDKIKNK